MKNLSSFLALSLVWSSASPAFAVQIQSEAGLTMPGARMAPGAVIGSPIPALPGSAIPNATIPGADLGVQSAASIDAAVTAAAGVSAEASSTPNAGPAASGVAAALEQTASVES